MCGCYWLPPPRAARQVQGHPITGFIVHEFPARHAIREPRRSRRGLTLLELLVTLLVLGLASAMAIPAFTPPAQTATGLGALVRSARGAAIARAEVLELHVAADATWELLSAARSDAAPVAHGSLDHAPAAGFKILFTPLGVCLPTSPLPGDLPSWDVAGCAAATRRGDT